MNEQKPHPPISSRQDANAFDSSDSLEPVELLADEFIARQRAGEKPTIDEYCAQHPELADEIREVFPALVVMEQVAPATADLDASDRSFTSPDQQPIESIGDYRLLRELGRGGMGVVYEAEQGSLGRRVALKVLPRHIAKDEKARLRFQREARAAAKMHHTNIVPVFEVGHENEYSFYAMQLIKGQGLDHVIADLRELRNESADAGSGKVVSRKADAGPADRSLAQSLMSGHFEPGRFSDGSDASQPDEIANSDDDPALKETIVAGRGSTVSAVLPGKGELSTAEDNRRAYFHSVAEIGLQAARAMSYAHARGITHRDIKPSNLILDTAGVVWITDFGLAHTGESSMTQTGDILGTIRYMSPERFKGQCDNRADVYSLGLTLYEMLVLKPAFESPDRLRLIDAVTKTEVASPRSADPRIPRDLETIVLKACDKDPRRRYQSADDMADDLQRFVSDEPILARRASTAERVARWSRRNPWLATAVSVTAAALIAVAGISMAAAQTQATLNAQLTDANSELNEKAQEQQATNQALIDSNKSKEELIRDLKRSQSRLAEKQAEVVAEKGDLAESMLWLARSYELAEAGDTKTATRLLSQLSQVSERMPILLSEFPIERRQSASEFISHVYGMRNPDDSAGADQLTSVTGSAIGNRALGRNRPTVRSKNILVFPTSQRDANGNRHVAFRCYDLRTGKWTGRLLTNNGFHVDHAIDATNRRLATVTCKASPIGPVDEAGESASIHARIDRLTQIRNIDSGEIVWEDRLEFSSVDNSRFVPHLFQELQTRVAFSAAGKTLLRFCVQKGNLQVFGMERIAIDTGETTEDMLDLTAGNNLFTFRRIEVSRDGQRLQVIQPPSAAFTRPTDQYAEVTSCDLENGDPVGKPIRFDDDQPLFLSESATAVAVIRSDGHRRRIQVHDVKTGQQIGESYDLDVPMDTKVSLRASSSDGSRLAIAVLPAPKQSPHQTDGMMRSVRGWVQVVDLSLRTSVTPRLPTEGGALDVIIEDDQILIRDEEQLRVWKLRGGKIERSLVAGDSSKGSIFNLFLPLIRALPKGQLLTAGRFAETEVTKWNAATGQKVSSFHLPATGHHVLAFDRSGEYVLTGVGREYRSASIDTDAPLYEDAFEVQCWELESSTPVGPQTVLPSGYVPVALGNKGSEVAVVVQPNLLPGAGGQAPVELRILNLQTQGYRDVLIPRKPIVPSFVEFDATGQRLFVISGPEATFDEFDLSDSNVNHLKSVPLAGFAPIPRLTPLTFSNGSWAVSGDGRSIAGYRHDGALRVQDLADGATTHAVPLEPVETITPSQLVTSFSSDAKSIYFGRPGGFFFASPIAGPWVGSPKQVYERLRTSIGMDFGPDDTIQFANLAQGSDWTASASPRSTLLEDREFQTIQHVIGGQWELANEELGQWAQRRPADWLPLPFRVLVLLELGKLDEAEQMLHQFVIKAGGATAAEWLRRLAESSTWFDFTNENSSRFKPTHKELGKQIWFHSHRLDLVADNERTPSLFALANAKERQLDFDGAIAAINEAVQRDPDSSDMHRFRIRLLERLGHSEAAIESHQALVRLRPWDRSANYHLTTVLLHAGDTAAYHDAWRDFRSQFPGELKEEPGNEQVAIRARDQLAKARLILDGEDDETLRLALGFADANYQSGVAMKSSFALWCVQCKGLAEFRRGQPENLNEAIRILDIEFPRLEKKQPKPFLAAAALARFVIAMSHHKLGETDKAQTAYLDGLDWHKRAENFLRSSDATVAKTGANDWHAAEIVRREAESLLGIDLNQIDPAITDTSNWQVLFEDNFDDGISDQWQRSTGEWEVVDGAAVGVLRPQDSSEIGFGRLERKLTDLPSIFEVEYETWSSDPMLSACLLRHIPATSLLDVLGSLTGSTSSIPLGHRVALASLPNDELTKQGKPGGGVSLGTIASFGFWFNQTIPSHVVEPNRHYKVRIIRQPQRITVFVDGEQVLSERVRDLETRAIRFFGRGEEGTTLFVDNVKVRVPEERDSVVEAER